jgi:hypothetical protein
MAGPDAVCWYFKGTIKGRDHRCEQPRQSHARTSQPSAESAAASPADQD